MKTKAFAYLRVSTTGQIDKGGFERQRQTIENFCRTNGVEIVKTYSDAISGTTGEDERPAFTQMLSDLLSNGVKTIVVESLDRLAREYRIQEQLLIYLLTKGLTLIAATTGEDVTAAISGDPMKRAMGQMQGIFFELERNIILNRLKNGRETKRKTGERAEGPPRYGECDKTCKEGKHSDRCVAEKAILNEMARMRMLPRPTSYSKIATTLNAKGLKPRNAESWSYMLVYQSLNREKRMSC